MELIDKIRDRGILAEQLSFDGLIYRCGTAGNPHSENGWIKAFPDRLGAIIGDWGGGWKDYVSSNGNKGPLTEEKLEAIRQASIEANAKREQDYLIAAQDALTQYESAEECTSHPYLEKKKVLPVPGLRMLNGDLIVPGFGPDDTIQTIQRITPGGTKLFHKGGRAKGASFFIDGPDDSTFYFAEGLATALAGRLATDSPVFVCFNAGNLVNVARMVREAFPDKPLVILADNDSRTPGNPGLQKAREAAKEVRGLVAAPQDHGDWNDVLCRSSPEQVREEIRKALKGGPGCTTNTGLTAYELMKMDFPEPTFVVPGIIPEGLTIFGGKPKHGKSILATNLAVAITAQCGMALEQIPLNGGAVLYLALEDNNRRLKSRIKRMLAIDEEGSPNLHLFTEWKRMGQGGMKALDEKISSIKDLKLVIIDTFVKMRPITKANGNQYEVDYENVSRLKDLADKHGVSFLLIHHLRKMDAEDPFDTFSGSLGLTGAADNMLVMMKDSRKTVLHVRGRDIEDASLAIELDSERLSWRLLGDASEVQSTRNQQEVFDTLKAATDPMGPQDIADATGQKTINVKKILRKLLSEGSIGKAGHGKYIYRLT